MTTTNARKILEQIVDQSSDHTADERFVRVMEIGRHFGQGDLYIERVADDYPRGAELRDMQLAPGISKGSRHVAVGCKVFACTPEALQETPMHGPVIVAEQRFQVTHPEHADVSLPSGTYRVGYQLDPRTMRRVAD